MGSEMCIRDRSLVVGYDAIVQHQSKSAIVLAGNPAVAQSARVLDLAVRDLADDSGRSRGDGVSRGRLHCRCGRLDLAVRCGNWLACSQTDDFRRPTNLTDRRHTSASHLTILDLRGGRARRTLDLTVA